MKKDIELSIIIPFYHGERYIFRLMESFLNSYNIFKLPLSIEILILVDSMSTSLQSIEGKLEKFQELWSISITKNKDNLGVAETRNRGIKISNGKFLYFIDQDDEVTKDFFSLFNNCLIENFDFVLFNGILSYSKKKYCKIYYIKPTVNLKTLIIDDYIRSPGQVIINRSFLGEKVNYPVPNKHHGSDDKFFYIELFKEPDLKHCYINKLLYKANIHEDNYSNNQIESMLSSLELLTKFKFNNNISAKELNYINIAETVLNYRLGNLSGVRKIKACFYFILYKFNPNKIIRFLIRASLNFYQKN